ncbi:MAG TPA: hypothetical protein VEU07_13140 [Candidatus Acidoferrum sp.]|nr:hypothetical protein [Candidatus Acidoferrum sp.]
MSKPFSFTHPTPNDVRTCTEWSCLHRAPAFGPDPAVVLRLVDRVVQDVAARIIMDAEVHNAPEPWDTYEGQFLDQFWCGLGTVDTEYSRAFLEQSEFRGLLALEQLVAKVLPRLLQEEQLLICNRPLAWRVPAGRDKTVAFRGRIARVGREKATGTIRLYDWLTGDYDALDWLTPIRHQQTGLAMRWLQKRYPTSQLTSVQTYLVADVTREQEWRAEDLRSVELVARAQAMIIAERDRAPLGQPPVPLGRN